MQFLLILKFSIHWWPSPGSWHIFVKKLYCHFKLLRFTTYRNSKMQNTFKWLTHLTFDEDKSILNIHSPVDWFAWLISYHFAVSVCFSFPGSLIFKENLSIDCKLICCCQFTSLSDIHSFITNHFDWSNSQKKRMVEWARRLTHISFISSTKNNRHILNYPWELNRHG